MNLPFLFCKLEFTHNGVHTMSRIWQRTKEIIRNISIVDRFLMIFMMILFIYIICHLFGGQDTSKDINTIHIIVRTSVASIFGYFISNNFVGKDLPPISQNANSFNSNLSATSVDSNSTNSVKNQIGFQTSSTSSNNELQKPSLSETPSSPIKSHNKTQIITVSIIGLISLIILLVSKNFQNITPEFTATISQLRDFVSGCIGFLISCGKNTVD